MCELGAIFYSQIRRGDSFLEPFRSAKFIFTTRCVKRREWHDYIWGNLVRRDPRIPGARRDGMGAEPPNEAMCMCGALPPQSGCLLLVRSRGTRIAFSVVIVAAASA